MAQFGVALIGAGMIARTHVLALSELKSRCQLRAIVSTRPARAEYLSEFYQGSSLQFTNNLSDVLKDSAVKFVIVATPPSVRIDLIEALAKAGKHILLEKPLARNVDESRQVVEICKQANVTLGVLFQHRMWDTSIAAASMVASGELGHIGLVEIAAPLWRPQSYYDELDRGTYDRDGGGVMITQAIHTIDLALSLAGPVTRVQAMTATTPLHKMEAEDFAVAGLQFLSGAVGSLVASTATFPQGKESISLHGENGTLHLRDDAMEIFWRDGGSKRHNSDVESTDSIVPKYEWHKRMIENFIDSIEQGSAPMVTGSEALGSQRLIQAIEESSRAGSSVTVA